MTTRSSISVKPLGEIPAFRRCMNASPSSEICTIQKTKYEPGADSLYYMANLVLSKIVIFTLYSAVQNQEMREVMTGNRPFSTQLTGSLRGTAVTGTAGNTGKEREVLLSRIREIYELAVQIPVLPVRSRLPGNERLENLHTELLLCDSAFEGRLRSLRTGPRGNLT